MTRLSRVALPALACSNVLAGMLLVPAARPLLAARFPGVEYALHAFFSVNMLGAVVGAPLMSWLADRFGTRRAMAVALSLLDAALLLACLLPVPLWAVLALRTPAQNATCPLRKDASYTRGARVLVTAEAGAFTPTRTLIRAMKFAASHHR